MSDEQEGTKIRWLKIPESTILDIKQEQIDLSREGTKTTSEAVMIELIQEGLKLRQAVRNGKAKSVTVFKTKLSF